MAFDIGRKVGREDAGEYLGYAFLNPENDIINLNGKQYMEMNTIIDIARGDR